MNSANNPLNELKAVRNPAIWMSMIIGSVGFAGMFCAFSYQAPTLINQAKADPSWIPVALAAFGLGGISGNIFGGWLFDRLQFRSLGLLLLWGTIALLIYPLLTYTLPSMLLGLFSGRHHGVDFTGAADPSDGHCCRCTDAGRRVQCFRL